MSSTTTNLGLLKKDPLADGNDTFNIKTMLNDNWDTIDAFAGQTTPIARGGTGATTADSARTNLGIPAAVQNILTTGGYSRIQVGSYVGTGTYGASNPCSLTFDFSPRIVLLFNPNTYAPSPVGFIPGQNNFSVVLDTAGSGVRGENNCSIAGNTASWHFGGMPYWNDNSAIAVQMNSSGWTYYYAALG